MWPTVETSRDPLNASALPDTRGMELDYRTQSVSPAFSRRFALWMLLAPGVGGLVTAVLASFAGEHLAAWYVLAPMALLGVLCGLAGLSQRSTVAAAAWVLAAPALWLLSIATGSEARGALAIPAFIALLALAHAITEHYARWAEAHPALTRETRRAWRRAWGVPPLNDGEPDVADRPPEDLERLEATEAKHFRRWRYSFLIIPAVAFLVAVAGDDLLGGLAGFVTFLLLALAAGVLAARSAPLLRAHAGRFPAITWNAIVLWLTYNRTNTRAPGVFQSPHGPTGARLRPAALVLLFVAWTILPAAAWLPFGVALSPSEPWAASATTAARWERSIFGENTAPPPETLHDALTSGPLFWIPTAVVGIPESPVLFVGSLLLSFLACIVAPALLLFATLFALSARRLAHHYLTLEGVPGTAALYHRKEFADLWSQGGPDSRGVLPVLLWRSYTERLRHSQHSTNDSSGRPIRERDHLLVGFSVEGDYPVLLSPDILREHAHILGDSGSGKTALGLSPLLAQLIGRPNASFVVIDLKGDRALFEAARRDAARNGMRFRWFTNDVGHATHAYNPFLQSHMDGLARHQRSEILLQALGLDYGDVYGAYYFSSVHREVLTKVLTEYDDVDSFAKLYSYLTDHAQYTGVSKKQQEDSSHLVSIVNALSRIPALNVTPENAPADVVANRIDMPQLVTGDENGRGEVVYFWLRSTIEGTTVREVAKLALYGLLTAAARRDAGGYETVAADGEEPARKPKHQVYLFIDEFQQVVSKNLEIVLRQARSMGIATILANHTLSDLVSKDFDLTPTVQASTRLRQYFSSSDVNQQETIMKASGEAQYFEASWQQETSKEDLENPVPLDTLNVARKRGERLMRNDVIFASDAELQSIVHVTRSRGLTQFKGLPFVVRSSYHITAKEHEERSALMAPPTSGYPGAWVPPTEMPRRASERPRPPTKTNAAKPVEAAPVQTPASASASMQDRLREVREDGERASGEPKTEAAPEVVPAAAKKSAKRRKKEPAPKKPAPEPQSKPGESSLGDRLDAIE